MFKLEKFVENCRDAVLDDPTHKAVAELTVAAMKDPSAVTHALANPRGQS